MLNRLRQRSREEGGFTLIELLNGAAFLSAATGTGTTWTVTAKAGAASGDTFTISRVENATITCTESGKGGCAGGKW